MRSKQKQLLVSLDEDWLIAAAAFLSLRCSVRLRSRSKCTGASSVPSWTRSSWGTTAPCLRECSPDTRAQREPSRMNLFVTFFFFFFIDDSYGQTGTGKTFTMEGERSPDEQFTWEEVSSA